MGRKLNTCDNPLSIQRRLEKADRKRYLCQ
jgi:hypothetical protein